MRTPSFIFVFGLLVIYFIGCTTAPAPITTATVAPGAALHVTTASITGIAIPQTLGTLKLQNAVQGTDALREFAGLHNQAFELVGGYRADYGDGNQTATLWVAQAKDNASATAMTQDMAKKIGAGNAMFQNLQELSINGRQLFVADGQGRQHYFYGRGNQVVWLAIDPTLAEDALHNLWNEK